MVVARPQACRRPLGAGRRRAGPARRARQPTSATRSRARTSSTSSTPMRSPHSPRSLHRRRSTLCGTSSVAGAAAHRSRISRSRTGSGCMTCWSAPRFTWPEPSPSRWRRLPQGRFAIISAKEAQAPDQQERRLRNGQGGVRGHRLRAGQRLQGHGSDGERRGRSRDLDPRHAREEPRQGLGRLRSGRTDRRRPGVPLLLRWRQDERTTHSSLLRRDPREPPRLRQRQLRRRPP